MDFVIEIVAAVWERRESIVGLEIAEAPDVLRHFAARFRRKAAAVAACPEG
jgi:tryptophanase